MRRWVIWYGDGTTLDHTERVPSSVPGLGVICIGQDDETCGRLVLHGYDYYIHVDDAWVGVDRDGLLTYLGTRFSDVGGFACGLMVPEDQFRQTIHEAHEDPRLSPWSAHQPHERAGRMWR